MKDEYDFHREDTIYNTVIWYNCLAGPPPPWRDEWNWNATVGSQDYSQTCGPTNWYKTSQNSIMNSEYEDGQRYNAITLTILNSRLNQLIGNISLATSPTAAIVSPVPGANVGNNMHVSFHASVSGRSITRILTLFDSVPWKTEYTDNFTGSYDITNLSTGSHTFQIKAFDAVNNMATAQITFNHTPFADCRGTFSSRNSCETTCPVICNCEHNYIDRIYECRSPNAPTYTPVPTQTPTPLPPTSNPPSTTPLPTTTTCSGFCSQYECQYYGTGQCSNNFNCCANPSPTVPYSTPATTLVPSPSHTPVPTPHFDSWVMFLSPSSCTNNCSSIYPDRTCISYSQILNYCYVGTTPTSSCPSGQTLAVLGCAGNGQGSQNCYFSSQNGNCTRSNCSTCSY